MSNTEVENTYNSKTKRISAKENSSAETVVAKYASHSMQQFFDSLVSNLSSKLGYTEPIARGFVSKIRIVEIGPTKIVACLQDTIYQGFLPTSLSTIREVARSVWGDDIEFVFSAIAESEHGEIVATKSKKSKQSRISEDKSDSMLKGALNSKVQKLSAGVESALFEEVVSLSATQNISKLSKTLNASKIASNLVSKALEFPPTPQQNSAQISSLFADPHEKILTADLTFQNFVRGNSNELAFSACQNVSANPGQMNNPLCIYGPSGLGKTHLLHAVGNEIIKNNPSWKVICISSEDFLNEYVADSRHGRMSVFRQRFRSCDVLLVDDIQFLEKKTQFQQEFFHTFNDLFNQRKQIVITSDKYPKEIPELTERLKSRFLSGLISDIEPPGYEDRLSIIREKAKQMDLRISKDVAAHIASLVKTNVREIQGVLVTLVVEQNLTGNPITIDQVNKQLKHVVHGGTQSLDVPTIQKTVSMHFGIKFSELMSPNRSQKFVVPRHIAMYLAKELLDISSTEIAECFGKKDHTTVMHAVGKVKELLSVDNSVKSHVQDIRSKLNSSSD